jgi:hypothetical protein
MLRTPLFEKATNHVYNGMIIESLDRRLDEQNKNLFKNEDIEYSLYIIHMHTYIGKIYERSSSRKHLAKLEAGER